MKPLKNGTITAEGPSESLFEAPILVNDDNNAAAEPEQEENSEERQLLPITVSAGKNMTRENVLELMNAGFKVDDNNEPVPENIPVATTVDAVADIAHVGGIKSRLNISSLDAPNASNRRAPTVNVAEEYLSLLIAFLFMF